MKDLVDLVLIGDLGELDADRLRHALRATFAGRAAQPLPSAVPPPPTTWARPYAEMARGMGMAENLDKGHADACAMLDPILCSGRAGARWDPATRRWE